MARGTALSLKGLPKKTHIKFARAVIFAGAKSQSSWLSAMVRRLIREQESKCGDLMKALTPDEADVVEVVRDGANDPQHISDETLISAKQLDTILEDLVSRGVLEVRRQGGKTDGARGARRALYFVTEK